MKTFIGKNTDFTVVWNCTKQSYTAYKNGKHLKTAHRFRLPSGTADTV